MQPEVILHKDTATTAERGRRVKAVYDQLRQMIVHGRLAPGTRLIEADLANRLGVSRTPVRDAVRLLQQEGFVVGNPGTGVKARLGVAPLTKEDARELYWIVGHIEGMAARRTAASSPPLRRQLARKLRALNDDLRRIARTGRGDPNRIFELDLNFHRAIVEASAGPRLLALHDGIKPQTERYWRLYASAIVERLGVSVAEHGHIIRAIERGDGRRAERAVEVNWQNGAERLSRVIDTLGERGSW